MRKTNTVKKPTSSKKLPSRAQSKPKGLIIASLQTNKGVAILIILAVVAMGLFVIFRSRAAVTVEKGVVTDITWGISRIDMDKSIELMRQSNVKWVRANISWTAAEPDARSVYNSGSFADYDYAISRTRAAGINVLMPVSDGVPYWASGDPNKHIDSSGVKRWNKYYKPANMSDYTNFMSYVVNRYKVYGVHHYEVWNEPNLTRFWPSGVSAASYFDMLKASYPVIKAADPESKVVLGGLSQAASERPNNFYDYLTSLYNLGARQYFDISNVHIYSQYDPGTCWMGPDGRPALDLLCGIGEIKKIMTAHGDDAKSLWITEMGWSTCAPISTCYGVTENQQADYLTKTYDLLNQSYSFVNTAFVYNFRNVYWANNDPSLWEANTGLLRTDFSVKPAYAAFKAYGAPVLDSSPPSQPTGLVSPSQTTSSINLTWVASTDDIGVTGYEVYRNNAKVITVGTNSYSDPGLSANTGYSYYVIAKDAAGNSSTASTMLAVSTPAPTSDITAPLVSITSPAENSTISRSASIVATSSDNIAVTKMEVWIDGSLRASNANSSSISYSWGSRRAASGAHTITVKAYDAVGNIGQSSVIAYK